MKAIRKLLMLDRDGRSLGSLFRALFQQVVDTDPVLSLAGVTIESAGIDFGAVVEGKKMRQQVANALVVLGLPNGSYESKAVKNHSDLVRRSDLIIVPDLFVEDALCLAFDDAWSKTVTLLDGMTLVGMSPDSLPAPATTDDYVNWAHGVGPILVALQRMIKETYSYAAIVKGICKNKGIASGEAHVARHSKDLVGFRPGRILVIDRAGMLMFKDLDPQIAEDVIKNVDPNVTIVGEKDYFANIKAQLLGKSTGGKMAMLNGLGVFRIILPHAAAVVCSRADYYVNSNQHGVPSRVLKKSPLR